MGALNTTGVWPGEERGISIGRKEWGALIKYHPIIVIKKTGVGKFFASNLTLCFEKLTSSWADFLGFWIRTVGDQLPHLPLYTATRELLSDGDNNCSSSSSQGTTTKPSSTNLAVGGPDPQHPTVCAPAPVSAATTSYHRLPLAPGLSPLSTVRPSLGKQMNKRRI